MLMLRSRWPGRSLARLLCFLVLCAAAGTTDVFAQLTDVQGSKDPAGIKRYEGSIIIGYDFRKFDGVEVLLGPVKQGSAGSRNPVDSRQKRAGRGRGGPSSVCGAGGPLAPGDRAQLRTRPEEGWVRDRLSVRSRKVRRAGGLAG